MIQSSLIEPELIPESDWSSTLGWSCPLEGDSGLVCAVSVCHSNLKQTSHKIIVVKWTLIHYSTVDPGHIVNQDTSRQATLDLV